MKKSILCLVRLFIGLFLYAVGIVFTINANLGLSPWDVFHQGVSKLTGITMGQASIMAGLVIVILDWVLGEKVGLGTIFNMLFIGIFMDLLMINHLVPVFNNIIARVIMMFVGMFVIGIASYFYISAGLGSGPRDGLMVSLTKYTGKSVRLVRNCIEFTVLVVGYFLGGTVGFGTLIMVIGGGYFVQFAFKIFKFDVRKVQHEFIDDYVKLIKERVSQKKKGSSVD
ncbi:YczE/YyaS/YitT family protein [Clostridium sp.]|uniref:YczE/YyaS/YitT family protein n=1 Tax=Clostridium sp. TaxID=1506 RepID=UPI003D6CE145